MGSPPGVERRSHYIACSASHRRWRAGSMTPPPRDNDLSKTVSKNPHAVALGRLGGVKGGLARAKALSPRRRREIARRAGAARARALSASERQAVARRGAAARWGPKARIVSALEAPAAVRRLLKEYDPSRLRWAKRDHRYVIVREILLRGDDRSVSWLRRLLFPRELRDLIRRYEGAGCNELERQKLRAALHLTVDDIPARSAVGLTLRTPRIADRALS
jgi:hypothetical protein